MITLNDPSQNLYSGCLKTAKTPYVPLAKMASQRKVVPPIYEIHEL